MTDKKDWTVVIDPGVQAFLDANPEAATVMREHTARMHQALADLEAGRYKSMDEALRSIGMEPLDDDDIEHLIEEGKL